MFMSMESHESGARLAPTNKQNIHSFLDFSQIELHDNSDKVWWDCSLLSEKKVAFSTKFHWKSGFFSGKSYTLLIYSFGTCLMEYNLKFLNFHFLDAHFWQSLVCMHHFRFSSILSSVHITHNYPLHIFHCTEFI